MTTTDVEVANLPVPTRLQFLKFILVLGALSALAPLSIDMYLPALPTLAHDLGASTSLAQLSLTFCLFGLAIGQLIAGPLSDARGRRGPLLLGTLVYTIASFLCAFTSSIWILIVLRLIQGLAGGTGIVIARAVVRDYFSGTALTKFYALLMLVNGAAPILAPIIGAQILRFTTWHGVFIILGILGVLMMLGVILALPESLPAANRHKGGLADMLKVFRHLLTDRTFVAYSCAQALVLAAMFGYISGSPFVLQGIFGVSPQVFSAIFATNGVGIIIAGQLSARWSMKYGELKIFHIGLGVAAVGGVLLFAAIFAHAGLLFILPPLFCVVASVGIVGTTGTSLALQNHGKSAGSASGLIGVAQMIGGALATPLVGLGGSGTAMPMGIVIVVCDIAAVICYIALVSFRKRKVEW